MNLLRRHPIAVALIALVLVSSLSSLPSLVDAVSGAPPTDADLLRPALYTVLAPISNVLDALTFLTADRAKSFLLTWMAVLAFWALWRLRQRLSLVPRLLAAALVTLAVPLAGLAAVLLPRPVPRLVTADSSVTVIDYHAHTGASHDGRHGWTLEDLANWHAAQGFQAAYVTDHNIVLDRPPPFDDPIRLLSGVEWSVDGQHVVALGGVAPIDRAAFSRDTRAALGLFAELHRQGAIGIASLPEYWHAWADLDAFVAAGVDGFEIVNCAPKAIGFPAAARERVLTLARAHDLLVVGATDNHGWGKVTCVWNLSSPGAHGYRANRVLTRPIALAQADWQPWTAAYTQPWLMLEGLSWSERSSWITWILVILIYRAVPRRAGDPGGIGILARSLSLKIVRLKRPPVQ